MNQGGRKYLLRDGLLQDIEMESAIYKVNATLEMITDEIHNIKLEVSVNLPSSQTPSEKKNVLCEKTTFGLKLGFVDRVIEYDFSSSDEREQFINGIQNQSCQIPTPGCIKAHADGKHVDQLRYQNGVKNPIRLILHEIKTLNTHPSRNE